MTFLFLIFLLLVVWSPLLLIYEVHCRDFEKTFTLDIEVCGGNAGYGSGFNISTSYGMSVCTDNSSMATNVATFSGGSF